MVDETVDTEEEATEDTTETTADESSQTIAQSDIILVTASLASAVATLAIIALITKWWAPLKVSPRQIKEIMDLIYITQSYDNDQAKYVQKVTLWSIFSFTFKKSTSTI